MILFEKFGQHQPLNRQVERYAKEGVEVSLSTLADQVGACTVALEPIHALIRAHILAAERLHGDDTTVPLLARGGTKTARLWTYVRDDRPFAGGAPPAALFHFSRDRGMANPNRHLADWQGILQADAYGGYNNLYRADRDPGPVESALCWSHARRKFFELADIKGNARKGKPAHDISPVRPGCAEGPPVAKVVTPAARREAVAILVERHEMSERPAAPSPPGSPTTTPHGPIPRSATRSLWSSLRESIALTMRAILLASAMATSIRGLRASMLKSHDPGRPPSRPRHCTTDIALTQSAHFAIIGSKTVRRKRPPDCTQPAGGLARRYLSTLGLKILQNRATQALRSPPALVKERTIFSVLGSLMLPPHKIDAPDRFPIMTSEGDTIAYVEKISEHANRLTISGWAAAESVGIVFGKVQVLTKTSIERPDVVLAHPHLKAVRDDYRFGFSLESEVHEGPRFLAVNLRNHSYYISLP